MRTMADGTSSNPNVGALGTVLIVPVIVVVVVLCLCMLRLSMKEEDRTTTLGNMAPLVSTANCPKIGEQFTVTVKGNFATATTDSHLLKLVKAELEGTQQTKFTFLPIAEGQVKIYLDSPSYRPEVVERRISRYTEDAWLVVDDAERWITIQRDSTLKSDDYANLRFDNEPVGEPYPITNFLFLATTSGKPEDKQPPVWTTSSNLTATAEKTRGSNILNMGVYSYRFNTRVSITRTSPGPGWVRISWKGLSRTIQIPDPQAPH